jgi:hypothetical protein
VATEKASGRHRRPMSDSGSIKSYEVRNTVRRRRRRRRRRC